ncbi:3-deoxy-7-phosphoheptulonate synthase [bacterium endosymbiont of Pedicinus badii]|uniref:3-deoxy-7-phosphoheptulonate synthase n=1 Tax=bacterium endosymbiont of Pedicinus badii TaxID=1719126 RepID=UPI0009BBC9AC|nr:3-deoxy-7-phosphoheptulonate synthase [bacterium endosymbiont of Pedicinus badii]OQM34252.1 hypothetical protein AOQ89_02895 [bacterium endosymbiont of Pedicinus badii]
MREYTIKTIEKIFSYKKIKKLYPINRKQRNFILKSRKTVANILNGKDKRFLVICGPCSIHEESSAFEYAQKLKGVSKSMSQYLYVIMRAYFEKSRTFLGWKGMLNDPKMDNSYDINSGISISRKILIKLLNTKIPLATEFINPIVLNFLEDLYSWCSIGARTSESSIHREMASGIPMPVAFKNSTNGEIKNAVYGMQVAKKKQKFLGTDKNGRICILSTKGNQNSHLVLRGGEKPNYYSKNIEKVENIFKKFRLKSKILIDCSHGNSSYNYKNQIKVVKSVLSQIKMGNSSIAGIILESNLYSGKQKIVKNEKLKYGISITDSCISFSTTKKILKKLYKFFKNIKSN